jgi:uncharacterized protein (TIGR02757 family)
MGFYHPATLVKDAQRRGVRFSPIDVQESDWDCRVDPDGRVRLGLMYVNGLRAEVGKLVAKSSRDVGELSPAALSAAPAAAPSATSLRQGYGGPPELQRRRKGPALRNESPAAFVRQFEPRRDAAAFQGFVHRWTRAADVVALLWVLRQMLDRSGSIEGFFVDGLDDQAPDMGPSIDSFSKRAMALDLRAAYGRVPARPGVAYFFPRPSSGSGCKRLNLFLRWMVRHDALDLGVWTRVPAAKLVVPLDTHIIRVGRCLRLTRYTSPGWKMAQDITASLRRLDPEDPVRYDFSMCHLGMMDACGFERPKGDSQCPLRGVCRPRGRKPRRSRRPSVQR